MAIKLTLLFAFVFLTGTALALTCYKCDSSESTLCNFGLGSFTYAKVNCDEEAGGGFLTNWIPKKCVKVVANGKDGSEYVARGCMPGVGDSCKLVAKTLGFFSSVEGQINDIDCFSCDGDKCNSATKHTTYTFLGVLVAAIAYLF